MSDQNFQAIKNILLQDPDMKAHVEGMLRLREPELYSIYYHSNAEERENFLPFFCTSNNLSPEDIIKRTKCSSVHSNLGERNAVSFESELMFNSRSFTSDDMFSPSDNPANLTDTGSSGPSSGHSTTESSLRTHCRESRVQPEMGSSDFSDNYNMYILCHSNGHEGDMSPVEYQTYELEDSELSSLVRPLNGDGLSPLTSAEPQEYEEQIYQCQVGLVEIGEHLNVNAIPMEQSGNMVRVVTKDEIATIAKFNDAAEDVDEEQLFRETSKRLDTAPDLNCSFESESDGEVENISDYSVPDSVTFVDFGYWDHRYRRPTALSKTCISSVLFKTLHHFNRKFEAKINWQLVSYHLIQSFDPFQEKPPGFEDTGQVFSYMSQHYNCRQVLTALFSLYDEEVARLFFICFLECKSFIEIIIIGKKSVDTQFINRCFKTYKENVHAKKYKDPFNELQHLGQILLKKFQSSLTEKEKRRFMDEYLALKAAQMDSLCNVSVSISHKHEGFLIILHNLENSSSPELFRIMVLGRQADALSTTGEFQSGEEFMRGAYLYADMALRCCPVADMVYKNVVFKLAEFEHEPSPWQRNAVLLEANRALWCLEEEEEDLRIFWGRMILLRMVYAYAGVGKHSKMIPNGKYYPSQGCIRQAENILQNQMLQKMELRREMFKSTATAKLYYEKARYCDHKEGHRSVSSLVLLRASLKEITTSCTLCQRGNYSELGAVKEFKKKLENFFEVWSILP